MVLGLRMAPPSPLVTLVIICVSLSISEAFLALTSSSSRYSSSSSSSSRYSSTPSRLWRIVKSSLTGSDDRGDAPFIDEDATSGRWRPSSGRAEDSVSGRWRRASDDDSAPALADAYSSSGAILTGMGPGPGNSDASFEDEILTVVRKEKMKIKLFGAGFSAENRLKFDNREQDAGTVCEHQIEGLELEFDQGTFYSRALNYPCFRYHPYCHLSIMS